MAFAATILVKHSKTGQLTLTDLKRHKESNQLLERKKRCIWTNTAAPRTQRIIFLERIKHQIIDGLHLWRGDFGGGHRVKEGNTDVDLLKIKNLNKVLLLKQTSSVWGIKEKSHHHIKKTNSTALHCALKTSYLQFEVYIHTLNASLNRYDVSLSCVPSKDDLLCCCSSEGSFRLVWCSQCCQ